MKNILLDRTPTPIGARNRISAAVVCVILLFAAACGGAHNSPEATGKSLGTIRMITAISQSTPFIAAETGNELNAWKNSGITVKEIAGNSTTVTTALASGTADIAVTAGNIAALASASGVATVIPACIMAPWRQNLIVAKGITSASDLKGKTFGISAAGTAGAFATTKLADSEGWSGSDYKTVALGTIQGLEAGLSSGRIQAFIWNPAVAADLAAKGEAKDLGSLQDTVGPNCFEAFQVSNKLIKDNPEAVKAFFEGYFKNVTYLKSHYDVARKIVVDDWHYDAGTVDQYLKADIAALSDDGKIDSDQMHGLFDATRSVKSDVTQDQVDNAYQWWGDLK